MPYFESGRLTCRTLQSGSNLCSDSTGENAVYVTAAASMFLFSGLLTWALLRACGSEGACQRLELPKPRKPCDCFCRRGCEAPHLPITCMYGTLLSSS